MLLALVGLGLLAQLEFVYAIGVALTAALLAYEHRLVRASRPSRIDVAFFTVNGCIELAAVRVHDRGRFGMSAGDKGSDKARDVVALFSGDGPAVAAFVSDEELKKDDLLKQVLALAGKDASVLSFAPGESGDKPNAELARLEADLRSRPLFGGRKVIVVRDGDGFVKRCGAEAERLLNIHAATCWS